MCYCVTTHPTTSSYARSRYVLSTLRKVESSDKTIAFIGQIVYFRSRKSTVNRPIPTPASSSFITDSKATKYSGTTRQCRIRRFPSRLCMKSKKNAKTLHVPVANRPSPQSQKVANKDAGATINHQRLRTLTEKLALPLPREPS